MNKIIYPATKLQGEIHVPGDKSISHRALMISALAEGKSQIYNLSDCADVKSTAQCLKELGVEILGNDSTFEIHGMGLNGLCQPKKILNAGNSGTTMRLLSGILAGQNFSSSINGDDSLRKRPMKRIINPLRKMGANISGIDDNYAPLEIKPGNLKGITHELEIASAQVKSCILLAGLFASGETAVKEPTLSRDHTERMLKFFGAKIKTVDQKIIVKSASLEAKDLVVPGDISSAAFFLAAAVLVPGSEIRIKNVGINATRTGMLDVLKIMGANIRFDNYKIANNEQVSDLIISAKQLKGVEISGALIPRIIDEIPIISILATQAQGKTVIKDASELRVKETDRISAVVINLKKMGIEVQELPDGMIIFGGQKLKGAKIDSFGDHRVAMAFAVAGLIAQSETEIVGAECVEISYPEFFKDLEGIYA